MTAEGDDDYVYDDESGEWMPASETGRQEGRLSQGW